MSERIEVLVERQSGRILEARIGGFDRPRSHQRVRRLESADELNRFDFDRVPCTVSPNIRILPEFWVKRARKVLE